MTLGLVLDVAAKVYPKVKPYLPAAGMALLALLLVHEVNAKRAAEVEARRQTEAAELQRKGLIVARDATETELKAQTDALAQQNQDLRAKLDEIKRNVKARPVSVISAVVSDPHAGQNVVTSSQVPAECLLRRGEPGQIRVEAITLKTEAGNHLVAGAASCWKLNPPAELLHGVFQASATVAAEDKHELQLDLNRAGWGLGAWATVSGNGGAVGPAVAFPPVSIFGLQIELTAGVGTGKLGPTGMGQVMIRW